jgi:hypothetical protein
MPKLNLSIKRRIRKKKAAHKAMKRTYNDITSLSSSPPSPPSILVSKRTRRYSPIYRTSPPLYSLSTTTPSNSSSSSSWTLLCDLPHHLLVHIFNYTNNQKELVHTYPSVCRRFCETILGGSHGTRALLWSSTVSRNMQHHSHVEQQFQELTATGRTFYMGWYNSPCSIPLIKHHQMNQIVLCELEISLDQYVQLFQCSSLVSLKLYRVKVRKQDVSLFGVLPKMNYQFGVSMLNSLTIDCCNDLPSLLLNHTIGKCQSLTSLSLIDSQCVTNDTIQSCIHNQLLQQLYLKQLSHVTHDCVIQLMHHNCHMLNSIHIESCRKISEWRVLCSITHIPILCKQLTNLSLIGLDIQQNSGKLLMAGEQSPPIHMEDMQQLVQQTLLYYQNTNALNVNRFESLKQLVLQGCNEQFTNIALNRITCGMWNNQLQTLKLSTNNNSTTTTNQPTAVQQQVQPQQQNQQQPQKVTLLQKYSYYGLLSLKTMDMNMSNLHPNLIANLLHLCSNQVTRLNMSYGTFYNRGLLVFTQSARNVKQLILNDCSFESRQWFNIIVYNLPQLRDLTVKRVHVKQSLPQQELPDDLMPPKRIATQINRLTFDTLFELMGVDDHTSTTICDVREIGSLIIHSPQLSSLHVDRLNNWDILKWISNNLSHISPTNGLSLSCSIKQQQRSNTKPLHELLYTPEMHMFPPSVYTVNMHLLSNGFNAHLLLAICCENVQNKVNIVLSDQCEKELGAMLQYHYQCCMRNDDHITAVDRYKYILLKQIHERVPELIKHIMGIDDKHKERLLQKYLAIDDFDKMNELNHMNNMLQNCIEFLIDYEKQLEDSQQNSESTMPSSVCFLSYDDDFDDDCDYPMKDADYLGSSSSSCSIQ